MRISGAIVQMKACLLASAVPNHLHRSTIVRAIARHHDFRVSKAYHTPSQKLQCRSLILFLRDVSFEHLAFVVYSAPG